MTDFPRMHAVQGTPVFSVDGTNFSWADVIRVASEWGEWQALEQQARDALAAEQRAGDSETGPGRPQIIAAANAFRREHNLLSVDELERWTSRWGFSRQEWLRYVRRSLLPLDDGHTGGEFSSEEVAQATWIHALCSGALARLASRVAECAAIGATLGAGQLATADQVQEFCEQRVDDRAIDNELRARGVGLTRLRYRSVTHADEAVLREVVLCVREDGRELESVLSDAALELTDSEDFLEDTDPLLQRHLLAADPGDLVGPTILGDTHWLGQVLGRAPARLDDELLRDRVRRVLRARALSTEVQTTVSWHEQL